MQATLPCASCVSVCTGIGIEPRVAVPHDRLGLWLARGSEPEAGCVACWDGLCCAVLCDASCGSRTQAPPPANSNSSSSSRRRPRQQHCLLSRSHLVEVACPQLPIIQAPSGVEQGSRGLG